MIGELRSLLHNALSENGGPVDKVVFTDVYGEVSLWKIRLLKKNRNNAKRKRRRTEEKLALLQRHKIKVKVKPRTCLNESLPRQRQLKTHFSS